MNTLVYNYAFADQEIDRLGRQLLSRHDRTADTGGNSLLSGQLRNAYLFLKLFDHLQDEEYLTAAREILRRQFFEKEIGPSNDGFYAGRTGQIFLLLEAWKIQKEEKYLHRSRQLLKKMSKTFRYSHHTDASMLVGLSGTVTGLIGLQSQLSDPLLEQLLERTTGSLLRKIRTLDKGLYAHTNGFYWRPPCGFLRGTSGASYAFLQLSRYYGQQEFADIAAGICDYEDSLWDPGLDNWQDWSRQLTNDTPVAGDPAIRPVDVSWANGVAGITVNRLHALKVLQRHHDRYFVEKGIRKLEEGCTASVQQRPDHTLQSGKAGIGLTFIEAYRVTGDQQYMEKAMSLATTAGDPSPEHAMDWVYFLLMVHAPQSPSILSPGDSYDRPAPSPGLGTFTPATICRRMLSAGFERTISLLDRLDPSIIADVTIRMAASPITDSTAVLAEQLENSIAHLSSEACDGIREVFGLEKTIDDLRRQDPGTLTTHIAKYLQRETSRLVLDNDDDWLRQQTFKLSPDAVVVRTRWNWTYNEKNTLEEMSGNIGRPQGAFAVLLQRNVFEEVTERQLYILDMLLQSFIQPQVLDNVIHELTAFCASADGSFLLLARELAVVTTNEELFHRLGPLILGEVRLMISSGLLIPA